MAYKSQVTSRGPFVPTPKKPPQYTAFQKNVMGRVQQRLASGQQVKIAPYQKGGPYTPFQYNVMARLTGNPPSTQPAAAGPAAVPAPAPAAPDQPPDPRDSNYQAAIAAMLRQRDNQLTDLSTQDARDQEDVYGARGALSQLAEARQAALKDTTQGSNRQGLFYSGILGQRLGDTNKGYDNRVTDTEGQYRRRLEDRSTAKTRAQSAYDEGSRSAYEEAIARQLQRDLQAGLGADAQPDNSAPSVVDQQAQPTSKGYQERPGKDSKGNPGVWHIYPGRPPVFVRK